jgi:hypothetical protein
MMGVSYTIAAGPRQSYHSRVRVQRDSWPYFTVSDSRFIQPGGVGPLIYIPQEEGGPVIPPPGTGFPFRRLLRLDGTSWIAGLTNKNTTLKTANKWSRYGRDWKTKIIYVAEKCVWRLFVCKSKGVTGGRRKTHGEELYRFYYLLNTAMIK